MIRVRVDGDRWESLGTLTKPMEIIKCNLRGYWFEFEVAHANTGVEPFEFDGFEFIDLKVEEYVK